MNKAVIGIVQNREQAETVVETLQSSGVKSTDISVLFPNKQGAHDFAHEHNTKAPEGAVTGIGTGGIVGGAIGLLAGIGALAIPGLGPFIAAGPLMATLSGAAAGATLGGITGALVGLGIPEYEAKIYEGKIRGGNLLIAVHTSDANERKRIEDVYKRAGAVDVTTVNESSVPGGGDKKEIRI
jgi:uncharacterized membrane protein